MPSPLPLPGMLTTPLHRAESHPSTVQSPTQPKARSARLERQQGAGGGAEGRKKRRGGRGWRPAPPWLQPPLQLSPPSHSFPLPVQQNGGTRLATPTLACGANIVAFIQRREGGSNSRFSGRHSTARDCLDEDTLRHSCSSFVQHKGYNNTELCRATPPLHRTWHLDLVHFLDRLIQQLSHPPPHQRYDTLMLAPVC